MTCPTEVNTDVVEPGSRWRDNCGWAWTVQRVGLRTVDLRCDDGRTHSTDIDVMLMFLRRMA